MASLIRRDPKLRQGYGITFYHLPFDEENKVYTTNPIPFRAAYLTSEAARRVRYQIMNGSVSTDGSSVIVTREALGFKEGDLILIDKTRLPNDAVSESLGIPWLNHLRVVDVIDYVDKDELDYINDMRLAKPHNKMYALFLS